MRRALIALLAFAAGASAQGPVNAVEFSWPVFPRALWERELVSLKNIGFGHVCLPPASAGREADLADAVRIVRRIGLEADLEGAVPDPLLPQTKAHGGPLTDALPAGALRISALAPDALMRGRKALASAAPAIVWTDVEDTLGPAGFRAGAVNFAGIESPATDALRRNAQLGRFWGAMLASVKPLPGAGPRVPAAGVTAQQFAGAAGASFIQVFNTSSRTWTGDLRAHHPVSSRLLFVSRVTVPAHDSVWVPVNVPLGPGPLCRNCTAFSSAERVVSSGAELTAMEYENGILAMEFSAAAPTDALLQLSHEPTGPLVAGGKPADFDWDPATRRVRLPIPAGKGPGNRVRIGLAVEAPDATAFFDSAHVLLIGETNDLEAQFSSEAILQRSRLLTAPELRVARTASKEPLKSIFRIAVPPTAVHGDRTELAIEADGSRMSHASPQYLRPVQAHFAEGIEVQVGPRSSLPLFPATLPVNRRSGRDVTIAIRNNAPEIRSFHVELKADGLEFSPAKLDLAVGASAEREVSFRAFATAAAPGVHTGELHVTGAAEVSEAVRFVVIPPAGEVAWSADGFSFVEGAKTRAAFLSGRWLEFVNKDNGRNAIPAGGVTFAGPFETLRLADLEPMLPKAKK